MRRVFISALAIVAVVVLLIIGNALREAGGTLQKTGNVQGDPAQGRQMLRKYGCGGCHELRGVPGMNGRVGPSLEGLYRQAYLAGYIPNTPENLISWIQFPQEFAPGNIMPDLGVSRADAADIASYLYGRGQGIFWSPWRQAGTASRNQSGGG
ncbi:MAG TPA: hypothetical protein VK092_00285 [Deinococcales bacterium]|nr:hypothetical protein [Deinococcales bacterium]